MRGSVRTLNSGIVLEIASTSSRYQRFDSSMTSSCVACMFSHVTCPDVKGSTLHCHSFTHCLIHVPWRHYIRYIDRYMRLWWNVTDRIFPKTDASSITGALHRQAREACEMHSKRHVSRSQLAESEQHMCRRSHPVTKYSGNRLVI